MKKQTIIYFFSLLMAVAFHQEVRAQEFSKLDASPLDVASYPSDYKNSLKEIKIVYSRPQLKGRAIGDLAMNGKVWRTGANEASEITLYKDMKMGSTLVKAGTYTFYTIPGENEWTAIISKDLNVWGSYFYNEANDVARVTVPVTNGEDTLEAFSIAFTSSDQGVDMHLGWGNVRVVVPFTK